MLGKVVKTTEDFSKKVAAWNHSMIDKIEALRNKITKAHQIADGVRLCEHNLNRVYIIPFYFSDPDIDIWPRK